METQRKSEYLRKKERAYFIKDELQGDKDLLVWGDLMELVRGVNYIMEFYNGKDGFDSNNVLKALLKAYEIERLRGIGEQSFSVDSFLRESVFDIITRQLDN